MPTKKKTQSKRAKSKSTTTKKRTLSHRGATKAKGSKKSGKKKTAQSRSSSQTRASKGRRSVDTARDIEQEIRNRRLTSVGAEPQSDFQGLSRTEEADSESVDDLVEEGNVFEAGAIAGVEEADNADEREVHTHEVPEDDVPEEYLDKDQ